jgi:hypothetical protein
MNLQQARHFDSFTFSFIFIKISSVLLECFDR